MKDTTLLPKPLILDILGYLLIPVLCGKWDKVMMDEDDSEDGYDEMDYSDTLQEYTHTGMDLLKSVFLADDENESIACDTVYEQNLFRISVSINKYTFK